MYLLSFLIMGKGGYYS